MNRRIFRDVIIPAAFYAFLLYFCQTAGVLAFEVFYMPAQTGASMSEALARSADMLVSEASLISILGDGLTVLIVFIISRVKKAPFTGFVSINRRISVKSVFLMLVAGIAFNIWIGFMLSALPIPDKAMELYDEMSAFLEDDSVLSVLSAVLVAPVTEEIIFRGLIYKHFRICMPEYAAIILQALVFAGFLALILFRRGASAGETETAAA